MATDKVPAPLVEDVIVPIEIDQTTNQISEGIHSWGAVFRR